MSLKLDLKEDLQPPFLFPHIWSPHEPPYLRNNTVKNIASLSLSIYIYIKGDTRGSHTQIHPPRSDKSALEEEECEAQRHKGGGCDWDKNPFELKCGWEIFCLNHLGSS